MIRLIELDILVYILYGGMGYMGIQLLSPGFKDVDNKKTSTASVMKNEEKS
jgi:hypothetical protein